MKPWERYAAPQLAEEAAPAPAKNGPWSKYGEPAASAPTSSQPQSKNKPSAVAGVVSAMQGPTLGFYDEMVGATGAAVEAVGNLTPWGSGRSVGESYKLYRDGARASADAYVKENPILGHVERAVASVPMALVAPAGQVAKTGSSVIGQAAKVGAGYGAVAGAGDSRATDAGGISKDMATGAAGGAVLGPVVAGGLTAAGAAAKGIVGQVAKTAEGTRFADTVATLGIAPRLEQAAHATAAQKVAQAIERDAGGRGALTNPMDVIAARQSKLGAESTIADAGGQNTRQLLDTVATLPGKTKDVTERLIHGRQAGRADRLIGAAESGLGTNGARLPQTLEALDAARKQAAGPLYDRVRQTTLAVDPVLDSILERSTNAFGIAKQLAKVNGRKFTLDEATPGLNTLLNTRQPKAVPLSQLDALKRSLYDIEQGHINPETGRLSELGNAYKDLRRELVAKIDSLTADQTGASFYKAARDAYAGPTELRAAANLGSQAMAKDAWKISQMTDGMSASELEAFKIGAFESLRKKLGTEGGQTQILKMWKEPATSEKLRELFGDQKSFRQFAADVAREARLKRLESVGRGSQTASRAAGLGDLDTAAINEAGNAARSAVTGNVTGLVNSAATAWNKASTPEPVRDEIGRLLTARGEQGAKNLNEIRSIVEQILESRAKRAAQAGVLSGSQQ
jgi:hypothetical protein